MNCYLVNDSNPDSMPDVYIAQAVVFSLAFPLSFIGMVLNIVFICLKKTNFLVRRIVYTTVPTTLQLGALWLWSIPAFKRDDSWYQFCVDGGKLYLSATTSALWMTSMLFCSISFTLVTQLCGCSCCRLPWSDRSCFRLEAFLVTMTLFIGLVFGVLTYNIITIRMITDIDTVALYFFLLPFAILMISLIGNIIILYIWFCTLRRRQITRRQTEAALVVSEIKFLKFLKPLLLIHVGYFISSPWFTPLGRTITATFISPLPLLFFGGLLYIFCSRRNIETTPGPGLQTAPPSNRVSLPTDTAAHAPNFLSPSTNEPSEVTPLMT